MDPHENLTLPYRGNQESAGRASSMDSRNGDSRLDLGDQFYLIDLLPMAAYAVRAPDGVIAWFNSRAAELWGRAPTAGDTEERFCGAHKLYYPDGTYMAHCETPVALALNTGASVHEEEVVIERPDGSRVIVSVHIDPIRDEDGAVVGAVNFFHDITERKQAERALRESKEQLSTLASGLEQQVRARTEELEVGNSVVVGQAEQLRELSARLLQTQDDERRRIARELHDSVGQIITAIGMTITSVIPSVARNARARKALEEAQGLVHQLNDEVRTLSYLLHPPLLDEIGLAQTIQWYVKGLAERSGLQVEIELSDDFGRLPADSEMALFRIVQECLTNIHRHSGSATATIRLLRDGDAVSLEVQDQGQGIPESQLSEIRDHGSGVGIAGIRERVRHLKGKMEIHSDGTGTKIRVTLPHMVSPQLEKFDHRSAAG